MFTDLQSARLEGQVRIVKVNAQGVETDLEDSDDFVPVNNFPHSLFNAIQISIQG